jgi:hypothetical protein
MINKNSDTNIVGSSSFDPFSSVAYGSLPNTTSSPVTKDLKKSDPDNLEFGRKGVTMKKKKNIKSEQYQQTYSCKFCKKQYSSPHALGGYQRNPNGG